MATEKLVRDKLASLIEYGHEHVSFRRAHHDEALDLLATKLLEESAEAASEVTVLDDGDKLVEEFGDMLEAMEAVLARRGRTMEEVLAAKAKKAERAGGFHDLLILIMDGPTGTCRDCGASLVPLWPTSKLAKPHPARGYSNTACGWLENGEPAR